MKKYFFRSFRLAIVFTVTLIFMMPQLGFCNAFEGGPPEGYRFSGPAILGKLIITPAPDGELNPNNAEYCSDADSGTYCVLDIIFYDGNCKGTPFVGDEITGTFDSSRDFDTLVADDLEGAPFGQQFFLSIPENCMSQFYHSTSPYDVIINTVTKFNHMGSVINAEAVLLFLIDINE